jgi:hypothetical protein
MLSNCYLNIKFMLRDGGGEAVKTRSKYKLNIEFI